MSLKSLISTGTKVWLDGVEPDQIEINRALGIAGATFSWERYVHYLTTTMVKMRLQQTA